MKIEPDASLIEAWHKLQAWTAEIRADDNDITDEQTAREGELMDFIRDTPAQSIVGLCAKLESYWRWAKPDRLAWQESDGLDYDQDDYSTGLIFDAVKTARRLAGVS